MIDVDLIVSGRRFSGWEKVQVAFALDAVAAAFSLEVSSRAGFPIPAGVRAELFAGGELVADGFIDAVKIGLGPSSHTVSVEGRDKTGDLVDCSALNLPGEWYGLNLLELVRELATPYSIDVEADEVEIGAKFERFALQPGETAFEAIERACRLRSILPTGKGGVLILAKPGSGGRAEVALVEGENLKEASCRIELAARYRTYIVRGQHPGVDEMSPEESAGIEGRAEDLAARSPRALLTVAEGLVDPDLAQKRANWEATVRAARGSTFSVAVQGWQEKLGGLLWRPNRIVRARLPSLLFEDGELLVVGVKLSLELGENGGETAELELARKDAYLPEVILNPKDEPADFGADVATDEEQQ